MMMPANAVMMVVIIVAGMAMMVVGMIVSHGDAPARVDGMPFTV
jgi:hypothetical protein